MMVCWLARSKSIWILAASGKAFALDGALKGSLSVWVVEDLANAELAGVVVLSNCGPKVNNSKVLAVVKVAGIS